jgi:hypothetical protein
MADPGWLTVRVELIGGAGERLDPPPGRDFLASSSFSLAELATAIDAAFARWDIGHLHLFRFHDGSEYVLGGSEEGDETTATESVALADLDLAPRTSFEYVFDLGDEWLHRCEVLAVGVDPEAEFGEEPLHPVPLFGWGTIPDQYGRSSPAE